MPNDFKRAAQCVERKMGPAPFTPLLTDNVISIQLKIPAFRRGVITPIEGDPMLRLSTNRFHVARRLQPSPLTSIMQVVFPLETWQPRHKKPMYPDNDSGWQHARVDGFDTHQNILRTIQSILEVNIPQRLRDGMLSLQGFTDHARSLLRVFIPAWLYLARTESPAFKDEGRGLLKQFFLIDRHGEWLANNPQVDKRISQSQEICFQLSPSSSGRTWEILAHGMYFSRPVTSLTLYRSLQHI